MIRIVADERIPFLKGALDSVAQVDYLPGDGITNYDLKNADALITRTRTRCDRRLLEGTGVRFIASATIGYDHIDTEFCGAAGIEWTNAPGCNSSSVQQYMVSTLLFLIHAGRLDPSALTLGVVGVGHVGSKVVRAGEILKMEVLQNDPPRQRKEGGGPFVPLEELLSRSDIVTLHVPLNREGEDRTHHLAEKGFLERMKRGAILINTSRGSVVDEHALVRAIEAGGLSDVVLDVFENEPDIDPLILERITLATPHIAGYSADGKANGTIASVRAVSRFFGLGLDEWIPDRIPVPENRELVGDASGEEMHALLWELYRQTYDVTRDDSRLRSDPASFEKLRAAYPLRREPKAYTVRLFQEYPEIRDVLEAFGFSVLRDHCA